MAIEFKKNRALFRDLVRAEEAEGLLEWLEKYPVAKIDFSACTHVHPAVLQVLLAAKITVSAWPNDRGLCSWLKTTFVSE